MQSGSGVWLAKEQTQAGLGDLQLARELVRGEAVLHGHGVGLGEQGWDFAG
jgi:hypothetical protein